MGRISIAFACSLALLAPGGAAADTVQRSFERVCGRSVCASAGVIARVRCDRVAADTVSCQGSVSEHGSAGPADDAYLRLPGVAEWHRSANCGWFVVGGYVQDCGGVEGDAAAEWDLNAACCEHFSHAVAFEPVTYTSAEPFCLLMYLDAGSRTEATTTLLGLAGHETVVAQVGITEAYDIECASGGTDP